MIIPTLYHYQKRRGGYLTHDDMRRVSKELNVPLYRIQSLVSFFPHFCTEKPSEVVVHVCRDMACHLRGSQQAIERLKQSTQEQYGNKVEVCGVSCLGRCDRAPAVSINENLFLNRNHLELRELIDQVIVGTIPTPDTDWSGTVRGTDDWQIDIYDGASDYRLVQQYIKNPSPTDVIKSLETAGLLGMGGAGGRAYLKWGDVLVAEGEEKYLVCNADESEPGTFKDREIMLRKPHLLIEGMILAAMVVGAKQGWIYIRHEYPEQIQILRDEIIRAAELGFLGKQICDSEESFELDVYVSPGGYICGEQTALIEAMEGNRAEPRNRPPELMTNGYRNQPTLLNNVETLAWVPAILDRQGGAWFRDQGRKSGSFKVAGQAEQMRGLRFFSISGDIERPGVYEVPTGIPLGELIDKYCGGMKAGCQLAAVALSGPSGGFLPAEIPVGQLNRRFVADFVAPEIKTISVRDLPLDISVSRAVGYMLGAGIVIYGDSADVLAELLACSRFFRNESCGKCVPCRIGSEKITQLGTKLQAGRISRSDLPIIQQTIKELGDLMESTSICGLGQVASNPLRSLFRFFPEIAEKSCVMSSEGIRSRKSTASNIPPTPQPGN